MPTLETWQGGYLWKYIPNLAAAVIFATLFLLVTIAHTWKMMKFRIWYCSVFVIGGVCEVVGYTARVKARNHTGSLAPFIIQAIAILIAPIFFAGGLYIAYGCVVRAVHAENFSPISPRWCTWIFIVGDLLCLNIQSSGAGLLPNANLQNVANGIIISGLGLQVLLFIVFMWCCSRFHIRFRAHLAATGKIVTVRWETLLCMLYGTSILILVRNIFRLIEFIAGNDSYLFTHEWSLYVFDGCLMSLTMVVFFVWYPPQLDSTRGVENIQLVSDDSIYNARERYGIVLQ